jgi:cytochrome c oxidase assembly factor CtaG
MNRDEQQHVPLIAEIAVNVGMMLLGFWAIGFIASGFTLSQASRYLLGVAVAVVAVGCGLRAVTHINKLLG